LQAASSLHNWSGFIINRYSLCAVRYAQIKHTISNQIIFRHVVIKLFLGMGKLQATSGKEDHRVLIQILFFGNKRDKEKNAVIEKSRSNRKILKV
jgi:hypothetical protein